MVRTVNRGKLAWYFALGVVIVALGLVVPGRGSAGVLGQIKRNAYMTRVGSTEPRLSVKVDQVETIEARAQSFIKQFGAGGFAYDVHKSEVGDRTEFFIDCTAPYFGNCGGPFVDVSGVVVIESEGPHKPGTDLNAKILAEFMRTGKLPYPELIAFACERDFDQVHERQIQEEVAARAQEVRPNKPLAVWPQSLSGKGQTDPEYAALAARGRTAVLVDQDFGAWVLCGKAVRIPVTETLARLNPSELLFAFLPNAPPEPIDFRKDAEVMDGTSSAIYAPTTSPGSNCQGTVKIPYAKLDRFADYYKRFCAEHPSNLTKQAAVEDFTRMLQGVHQGYRSQAAALDTILFRMDADPTYGLVLEESDYSLDTRSFTVALDQPKLVRGLAEVVQGLGPPRPGSPSYQSLCNCYEADRWLRLPPELARVEIPMTVEQADPLIKWTQEHPGAVRYLCRVAGFTACGKCATTVNGDQRILVVPTIEVEGIAIRFGPPGEEFVVEVARRALKAAPSEPIRGEAMESLEETIVLKSGNASTLERTVSGRAVRLSFDRAEGDPNGWDFTLAIDGKHYDLYDSPHGPGRNTISRDLWEDGHTEEFSKDEFHGTPYPFVCTLKLLGWGGPDSPGSARVQLAFRMK